MSTIIDITNNSPRQTSTSTSSTSRRSPILTTTTHHHDTHSDTESDSDADWATRYGKRGADTDTDADGVKSSDKHDAATKQITTTDSDDEHEAKHQLISKVDIVHPVTAPLLHKTSALSFPDDNSVKRQPSVGVLQPVPQQSIYQRSNALLSCILLFLVIFQLMIGIMGLLLTISSWNVHCDYPLQFLSLAISVVFLAFGCVLAAYMCLVTAEQATKAFATLFCLLYFAGVPLFWVGLYWLHRSTTCDANLTEQLYQLYSPLFMVPWLVMLSSIVVIPVMLYYGCRSCTSKMNDEKSELV